MFTADVDQHSYFMLYVLYNPLSSLEQKGLKLLLWQTSLLKPFLKTKHIIWFSVDIQVKMRNGFGLLKMTKCMFLQTEKLSKSYIIKAMLCTFKFTQEWPMVNITIPIIYRFFNQLIVENA